MYGHHINVGSPTHLGALTVFPLWTETHSLGGIDWNRNAVAAEERAGAPVVGELVLRNRSPRLAPVLEGDLLTGGWQDGMALTGTLLAPLSGATAEVVCIEAGRWGGATIHDGARLRATAVARHAAATGNATVRQTQVWDRIGRLERNSPTATSRLSEHLTCTDGPSPFRRLPGQRGVAIGIGGRMLSIELFGSVAGLASGWSGIITAARLDAAHSPVLETPGWIARKLARRMAGETLMFGGLVGEGVTIAARPDTIRYSGLAHNPGIAPFIHPSRIIHLTAVDTTHPLLED